MSDTPQTVRICQNCGAELLGDHCYRCGQPVKGLVRHFGSIIGDFLDSVLNIDARIFRTLGPLLFLPGHLSTEYFEGRRVRYVSPVRLFVFLCVATFFVAQFSVELDENSPTIQLDAGQNLAMDATDPASIGAALVPAEVERRRDAALAKLDERIAALREGPGAEAARLGLEAGKAAVVGEAERRLAELAGTAAGAAEPPAEPNRLKARIQFGDAPWDPETNPIRFEALPDGANAWLNRQAGRAQANIERIQEDPNLLKDAFLSSIPATLFVLLPLFALMLKVLYLFKRRLYMEHLIVALHSHAFLCAALLVVLALQALAGLAAGVPWLAGSLKLAETVVWAWMPINLLIAQKRIYRQGWIMTLLKYGVIGTTYLVMIAFGAAFALMASMVWL